MTLWHVFKTYWTRPNALILSIFAAVLFALPYLFADRPFRIAPRISTVGNFEMTQTTEWKRFVIQHHLKKIYTLHLSHDQPGALPNLVPLRELRSLTMGGMPVPEVSLIQIAQLPMLESLQLDYASVKDFPAGVLTIWGQQLPHLKNLRMHADLLMARADELPELTNLQMLVVNGNSSSEELIVAVSAIPQLHTVVFDGNQEFQLSSSSIEKLRTHPQLKNVYARWEFDPLKDSFDETILSPVRALPLAIPQRQLNTIQTAQFMIAVVSVMLIFQLWSQFVSPATLVTPGYVEAHRNAGLLIMFAWVLAAVVWCGIQGVRAEVALMFLLIIPAGIGLVMIAQRIGSPLLIMLVVPMAASIGIGYFLPTLLFFPSMSGPTYWLFKGHYPWLVGGTVAVEMAILGTVMLNLKQVTYYVNERYSVAPGVSAWDPQFKKATLTRTNKWQDLLLNFYFGRQQYAYHEGSLWQQVKLLRRGNPFWAPMFAIIIGAMWLGMVSIEFLLKQGTMLTSPQMAPAFLVQIITMALLMPPMSWATRVPQLETESLRPVSRPDFVRQLFLSLAKDQMIAWVAMFMIVIYTLINPRQGGSRAESISFIPLAIAAMLWLYGLGTSVFAFRRKWVVLAFAISLTVVPAVLFIAFALIADEMLSDAQQLQVVAAIGGLGILASLAMIYSLYRTSLRREWG